METPKRKPMWRQKRVIFTLAVLIILVVSYFTKDEDQLMQVVKIVGMIITALGYIFQEAWSDVRFQEILKLVGIIKKEEEPPSG